MDITEGKQASIARKKLEDDLYQSQKLNSIGQLAGGVAHDFNNLLVPIIGYAEICQKALSRDSPLQGHLEKIKTAAGRAASLTKQLLAFSRQQRLDVSTLDLNIIARDFQDILRRLIPENIQMDVITCESPCHIKADRTQIEQILMNLSVNARDAMPDGGRLLIETSRVRLDELQTKIHPEITPGRYVMLAMTDTGHGIDPETQKRIFEPFFTTKEQGKGTGLGLATVFGIVKQHGGYIWVYSEKGKGATFKVYLPEAVGRARETETAAAETESAYGNETILLVEDDEMVRALTMKTLSGYGYRVLEAESPERALELAAEQGNGIDMLLTDVIMPGMNGRELYDRLSGIYPGLRVLYMSGYTGNIIFDHGISDEEINFLEKPFTATGLGAKIRAVLDKKSS
jgi:nitrogen-specific signal transduction histidine kinase/ActR/RegA family two-component response regulator